MLEFQGTTLEFKGAVLEYEGEARVSGNHAGFLWSHARDIHISETCNNTCKVKPLARRTSGAKILIDHLLFQINLGSHAACCISAATVRGPRPNGANGEAALHEWPALSMECRGEHLCNHKRDSWSLHPLRAYGRPQGYKCRTPGGWGG